MTDFDCCVNNEHDKGNGMSNGEAARAMYQAAQAVKETGGAVEIGGVKIQACDTYGRTESDRTHEAALAYRESKVEHLAARIGSAIVAVQDGQPERVIVGMLRGEVEWRGDEPVDAVQGDTAPQEPTDKDVRKALVREVSLAHESAWSDALECAEAPDRIADAVLSWLHDNGWKKTTNTEGEDVREKLARVLRGATDDGANRTEDMADAILAAFDVTPKEGE